MSSFAHTKNLEFFRNQDKRNYASAVNKQLNYISNPSHERKPYGLLQKAIGNRDTQYMSHRLSQDDFDINMKIAYATPDGYFIRYNPETGEKEMYVAGTRTTDQWLGNAYDALSMSLEKPVRKEYDRIMSTAGAPKWLSDGLYTPYNKSLLYRKTRGAYQNKLAEAARANNVDVVYGHSRGAALVADAPFDPPVQRVGLDGAMLIADNKDMYNLYEGGSGGLTSYFDEVIAITGKNNETLNLGDHIHHVWN